MSFDPKPLGEYNEVDCLRAIAGALTGASSGDSPAPYADGTYTVGIGVTQNGTITIQSGVITHVQEAS